ncbi:MAG: alkane 1-monooxygenase [Pseudorhodobacter sp.]|nr:alkane 1-monooxygenase [Pseudorhodobacter sp.]
MIPPSEVARMQNALPFWLSLGTVPMALIGMAVGGWTVLLMPLYTWGLYALLDTLLGLNPQNADLSTTEDDLFFYRMITLIWFPVQCATLLMMLWYVPQASHLNLGEKLALFFGMGVMSGTVGIVYAHELMHQKDKGERWLADLLLASVLYSHFRSEHLRVHHLYVGTPRDPVTARYGEGFHRYFLRVLRDCPRSAWRAEAAMLARKGLGPWTLENPFARYAALQGAMLLLALIFGGWSGLFFFVFQAFVAIWQLELVNYVEHYGLTRQHLGDGRYDHVLPRHSWNAAHKASNWLLINLQRHSDHHYKPDRRYPLLQNYAPEDAPQLPYGYPVMTTMALFPTLWRRVMNPRVRAWRAQFYPQVTDWLPYNKALNPLPKGAP